MEGRHADFSSRFSRLKTSFNLQQMRSASPGVYEDTALALTFSPGVGADPRTQPDARSSAATMFAAAMLAIFDGLRVEFFAQARGNLGRQVREFR
jgi:hypothetical protein